MDRPETRFAWTGDVSLAYQVCGDGPTDLVYLQGYCSNVDVNWESPSLSRFLRGLAEHARLIVTDRRVAVRGHLPRTNAVPDPRRPAGHVSPNRGHAVDALARAVGTTDPNDPRHLGHEGMVGRPGR